MKKPTLDEWMKAADLDREVVWDAQMDEAYARFVAMSECYLFEDNYEPFEQCKLYVPNNQSKTS